MGQWDLGKHTYSEKENQQNIARGQTQMQGPAACKGKPGKPSISHEVQAGLEGAQAGISYTAPLPMHK